MEFTCFFVFLHKVLYPEDNKMRFLWHRDNEKIDRISRSQYAYFEPCRFVFKFQLRIGGSELKPPPCH